MEPENSETTDNYGGLTPGRIVHYVMESYHHRAALIVNVLDGIQEITNLLVFCDPTADARVGVLEFVTNCPFSRDPMPGTWHWVEGSFTQRSHEAIIKKIQQVKAAQKKEG